MGRNVGTRKRSRRRVQQVPTNRLSSAAAYGPQSCHLRPAPNSLLSEHRLPAHSCVTLRIPSLIRRSTKLADSPFPSGTYARLKWKVLTERTAGESRLKSTSWPSCVLTVIWFSGPLDSSKVRYGSRSASSQRTLGNPSGRGRTLAIRVPTSAHTRSTSKSSSVTSVVHFGFAARRKLLPHPFAHIDGLKELSVPKPRSQLNDDTIGAVCQHIEGTPKDRIVESQYPINIFRIASERHDRMPYRQAGPPHRKVAAERCHSKNQLREQLLRTAGCLVKIQSGIKLKQSEDVRFRSVDGLWAYDKSLDASCRSFVHSRRGSRPPPNWQLAKRSRSEHAVCLTSNDRAERSRACRRRTDWTRPRYTCRRDLS